MNANLIDHGALAEVPKTTPNMSVSQISGANYTWNYKITLHSNHSIRFMA